MGALSKTELISELIKIDEKLKSKSNMFIDMVFYSRLNSIDVIVFTGQQKIVLTQEFNLNKPETLTNNIESLEYKISNLITGESI